MPLRPEELRQLCELLLSCKDDAEAAQLAQQLRSAIHDHVESAREKLPADALGLPDAEKPEGDKSGDTKEVA